MIPIMTYTFDTLLATKYGVNEAIMLNNFIYWIAKNEANGKHFHDGRYWTYNSVAAFGKLYPFWTTSQIRTIIDSLVKQGVLLKGNYNEQKRDRTVWYALTDESRKCICQISQMDLSDLANAIVENRQPLPNNKTQIETPYKKAYIADADADAPQPDKNKRFSYRDALIGAGVTPENADRLLANRRAKNLKNTEAAFNRLLGSLEQVCNARGVTYNEAIEYAGKHGWGAIEPGWNLEGLTAKTKRSGKLISLDEYIRRESQR